MAQMTTHPTDAEIAEIGRTFELVHIGNGLVDSSLLSDLIAAARDRNRLEAEMGSLSIVAGIRGDLCVAERKRCGKLAAENAKLREAMESVRIGGNHLAAQLIARVGADFSGRVPPDTDVDMALHQLRSVADFDIWVAWAAIMRTRAILSQLETDNG